MDIRIYMVKGNHYMYLEHNSTMLTDNALIKDLFLYNEQHSTYVRYRVKCFLTFFYWQSIGLVPHRRVFLHIYLIITFNNNNNNNKRIMTLHCNTVTVHSYM
jgi:hypothetical protein